jgi:hypothetical protein
MDLSNAVEIILGGNEESSMGETPHVTIAFVNSDTTPNCV